MFSTNKRLTSAHERQTAPAPLPIPDRDMLGVCRHARITAQLSIHTPVAAPQATVTQAVGTFPQPGSLPPRRERHGASGTSEHFALCATGTYRQRSY